MPFIHDLDFCFWSNALLIELQPINDLDFHPQSTVLISGAKDHTIKYNVYNIIALISFTSFLHYLVYCYFYSLLNSTFL